MSMNKALNATVALIEGRTDIAKEIIRSPGSDVKNVPEILSRLNRAVDRTAVKAIRNALISTLSVMANQKSILETTAKIGKRLPVDQPAAIAQALEDSFYTGAAAIEKVLEDIVITLEESL